MSPPAAGPVVMVRATKGINDREEETAARRKRVEDNMVLILYLCISVMCGVM